MDFVFSARYLAWENVFTHAGAVMFPAIMTGVGIEFRFGRFAVVSHAFPMPSLWPLTLISSYILGRLGHGAVTLVLSELQVYTI
jgi:hypothetical protein